MLREFIAQPEVRSNYLVSKEDYKKYKKTFSMVKEIPSVHKALEFVSL